MAFQTKTLAELEIDDERSFRHVALYADLKAVLLRDRYLFRVLPASPVARWDRALFLNLTFWGKDEGGDVLVGPSIPADVVAHVAWHHLASRALGVTQTPRTAPSVESLFLGESIASAFDVYLVGRLLGHAPDSAFLESQVSAMADTAADAGVAEQDFEALLDGIAKDPDAAFDDLRTYLYDVSRALYACQGATEALLVLCDEAVENHPFAPLLHRYELSNWVLYARAYAGPATLASAEQARRVDGALRGGGGLEWLRGAWLQR